MEMIKQVGEVCLVILGVFAAGAIFLFTVSLLLTALFLAVACARELWDIYLADIFANMRKRLKKEEKC